MIKTNWIIITGRPRSGKTKVIEKLTSLGYRTCPEIARIIIDDNISKKKSVNYCTNEFEELIYKEKINAETKFNPQEYVFWDRSPIDSIAFSELYERNLEKKFLSSLKCEYSYIFFMCELDDFYPDYATLENEKNVVLLEQIIINTYEKL